VNLPVRIKLSLRSSCQYSQATSIIKVPVQSSYQRRQGTNTQSRCQYSKAYSTVMLLVQSSYQYIKSTSTVICTLSVKNGRPGGQESLVPNTIQVGTMAYNQGPCIGPRQCIESICTNCLPYTRDKKEKELFLFLALRLYTVYRE
jgi:hypothetical protein